MKRKTRGQLVAVATTDQRRGLAEVGWTMLVLLLGGLALCALTPGASAQEEQPEQAEKEQLPKYLVTVYNGGNIVDVVEADEWEQRGTGYVHFRTPKGKAVIILNGNIVCRETADEDYAAVTAARERNKKLQALLSLKRQERQLKQEMDKAKQLAKEIESLEKDTDAPVSAAVDVEGKE